MKVCEKCKTVAGNADVYCSECGRPLLDAAIKKEKKEAGEKPERPFPIMPVIGLFAVFVFFALIYATVSVAMNKSRSLTFSYVKEGEIYLSQLKSPDGAGPERLTQSYANMVGEYAVIFDGRKIIYPDYAVSNEFVSYYENDKEVKIIDAEISEFHILPNKSAVYVKGSEKKLILNDFKGSVTELDRNVKDVRITDNGSLYYVKNSSIYGVDKGKIADGIDRLISVNDDGSCYFTRQETVKTPLADYVDDDLEFSDREIKEPLESDFSKNVLTLKGFEQRLNREDFNAAKKIYDQKLKRDKIRQELKEKFNVYKVTYLCYLNDAKEVRVSAKFAACLSASSRLNKILFTKQELPDGKQIKLSKILNAGNVQRFIDSQNLSDDTVYAATKGVAEPLFNEKSRNYQISHSGDIFYINNDSGLVKYRNKSTEIIADNVSSYLLHKNGSIQYVSNNELYYFDTEKYKIDEDVNRIIKNSHAN